MKNLVGFAIELKKKMGESGRTNIIPIRTLDEMFVRYELNLKEMEKLR